MHICPEALDQARLTLRREAWTRNGAAGAIADRLVALGQPIGPLNDNAGAILRETERLTPAALATLIEETLPGIERTLHMTLCIAAMNDTAQTEAIDPAMAVVFVRALTPLAGLRTYPHAALFRPADAAILERVCAEPLATARHPARHAVTGIVKITRACNLRCSYCHDWRAGPGSGMPPATQARAMRWLIAGSRAAKVNVLLHGGEPTIVGVRGLLRLLAFQAAMMMPGQQIRTSLQTNATLLTPALLELLVRFDIGVSVSLDGPPEVHDQTRRDIRGEGSSDRVRTGIAMLQDKGLLSGVIVVVTPALIAAGALRLVGHLLDCGVESAALIAQRPGHDEAVDAASTLPVSDYCTFLLAVEGVRRRIAPQLDVREIDAAEKAVRGLPPRTCELQGSCVGHYFTIEPDGAVSHCDKFLGDPYATLGTVFDPFEDVARGAAAERLRARGAATLEPLTECRWRQQCRGWCPHERDVAARSGAPGDCCGLNTLFEGLDAMGEVA